MKKASFWITIIFIAMVVLCTIFHNKAHQLPQQEATVTTTDSTLSIGDLLSQRERLIKARHTDSVFLAIPEETLVYMLKKYGTQLDESQIVEAYESELAFYQELQQTINKYKADQNQAAIDSLLNVQP